MTNAPKMTKRAAEALEILANGGRFIYQLEKNSYTQREQFQYRLMRNGVPYSAPVRGMGIQTFYELKDLGLVQYEAASGSGSWTAWKLNTAN